jgi:3-oxoacyl-[acyl-carrier protein] reductase
VAERLARRGDHVVIGYHSRGEKAREYAKRLHETYDIQTHCVRLDMTDKDSIKQTVDRIERDFSRLDILVHAAGVTRDKLLVGMKASDFDEVIDVHLKGAFLLLQAVVPLMRQRGYGRIVNVTSYAGIRGRSGQAAYGAAKAALIGLTKTVALEEIAYGITANCVAPSVTESAMTEHLSIKEREQLVAAITLGRMQTPEEAAGMIEWLTSEGAGTISGQVLMADTRTYGW